MRRELFVIMVLSVCKCLRMFEEFVLRVLNIVLYIFFIVLICGVDGERIGLFKVCVF